MLVRVGQGRPLRGVDAQMPNLTFHGCQSVTDLAKRQRPAELAEQHPHELIPAAETAGMSFRFVLRYQSFELAARKELENLLEHTAKCRHVGVPPSACSLDKTKRTGPPTFLAQKPN